MSLPFSLNPDLQNLPVYQPGRPIEEVARELNRPVEGIIKMASNENPFGPSPRAVEAMQRALSGVHLYPDGNAFYLKRKLAEKLAVQPQNLILGNGSNEVLEYIGHALLNAQSEVVVSQYCFAVYPIVTRLFGAKLVEVPARDLGHDLEAMLGAINSNTKVVFIANPNNPTGSLAPAKQILRFIEQAPPSVLVVLDEAYIDYLRDPLDLVPLVRSGEKPNLFLTRTFSKIYGLAGLRLGYGIGHPDWIAALEKIRQPFNINSLAQAGALAALDDQEHIEKTRVGNEAGLAFFEQAFRQLGWPFVPSSANFILVRVEHGGHVFQEMQKRGVIIRPMGGYQLPDWVRISVGTPEENARCLAALREVRASSPA